MTQPSDYREHLMAAALFIAGRRWPVFPLRPGGKRPALHGEASCPRTGPCADGHRKWEERATTDPDRVRRAWSAGAFNIGLATGPAGLLVIDLDVPKDNTDAPDGAANFRALCERHGQPVPTTRTVRTAGGGTHLYFTAPASCRLHNTAGKLAPLVDTRAWGGYVVAAGSVIGGLPYETVGPALVHPLPGWLQFLLIPPHPVVRARAAAALRNAPAYARAALCNEEENVRNAPVGCRNATLLRAARALGRLVASGDLSRSAVETALRRAGQTAGLRDYECRSTITSALNWSIAHNSGRGAA
ncbi:bifunctional DNA primase/polymerase [Streptomyces gamaensis]|uniref:Bifunctional DNA primase/polymerase n=1 Tax=Streptomyces gamaensis TaxID=1763542 RepID=A0ABW0Z8X6_9ACTN